MTEYIPIAQLQLNQSYHQIFLIQSSIKYTKRTELELIDVTGRIKAVYWDKLPSELIQDGKYVFILGVVRSYKDTKQLVIKSISNENEPPLNITDYISGPNEGILSHYSTLLNEFLSHLEDSDYRDLVNYSFGKLNVIDMLKNSPYGLEGPMANRGGLLLHVVHHLQTTIKSVEQFCLNNDLKINKSLLVAGCIFRNLGWATTTTIRGSGAEPLDAFYTISPQMSAFRIIDHACLSAESDLHITIPESHKQALSNVCMDKPTTLEGQMIVQCERLTNILEIGHNILLRSNNKNWADKLFIGHL